MKFKTFTLRTNLLSKLLLSLALLIGSANMWADDIIIFDDGTINGWINNASYRYTISNNELVAGASYGRLQIQNYSIENKKIVIVAKRTTASTDNSDCSYIQLGTYVSYSWTAAIAFHNGKVSIGGSKNQTSYELYDDDYIELISDNISSLSVSGTGYMEIRARNVAIKSIKLVDTKAFELDENSKTALQSNTKDETVLFKYSAQKTWNTICVPFKLKQADFDHVTTIFGTDWKAYVLASCADGTLTFTNQANYGDSNVLAANKPYLIYAPNATKNDAGVELMSNVEISYSSSVETRRTAIEGAIFQGTYVTKTYNSATDAENPWYGVTPAGRIMKAGQDPDDASRKAYVKGYHAYFTGVTAAEVKMMILDDDGGTTDLGFVKMVDENAKEIYNLAGQKVQKGRKGIYIVNGKKVVIK